MIITKKNILLLLSSIVLSFSITGCSSMLSSKPPLPATLNIVTPSPDIPPEIAAFSGIWEGKWGAIQDTIIVIEKVDTKTAEVIISVGSMEATGIKPPNHYMCVTATVLSGPIIEPVIEWSVGEAPESDCPCKFTLEMDKGLNNLTAFYIFEKTKSKFRADLTRRK